MRLKLIDGKMLDHIPQIRVSVHTF